MLDDGAHTEPEPIDLPDVDLAEGDELIDAAPGEAPSEASAPGGRASREIVVDPEMRVSRTERVAAQGLARLALMDLRLRPTPTREDYRIAALAFQIAERIDPTEPAYTRHRLYAAYAADDQDEVIDATRRLLRFDPSDTVAQLRLVSAQVAGLQTVEARLSAYARLLEGPRAGLLAPEVRSRLALDAALLANESGDREAFVRWLTEATTLDQTNKEAASLAYTYFSERLDDARGRLDLLMNLLIADPLDANVHLWISDELAAAGAFRGAREFNQTATGLLSAGRSPTSRDELELRRLSFIWLTDGPEAVAQTLTDMINGARVRARTARRDAEKNNFRLPEDFVPPEELRLGLRYEWMRLFAADAAGDDEIRTAASNDFLATISKELADFRDESRWPAGATRGQMVSVFVARLFEIVRLTAIFGGDDEMFESVAGTLRELVGENETALSVVNAWGALQAREYEDALARFRRDGGGDTVASLIGAAIALERMGERAEAASTYKRAASADPAGLFGPWAISRARALGDREPLTPDAEAFERFAQRVPSWVRALARNPSQFFQLEVEPVSTSGLPTEPLSVRVRLRNLAPVPLGLGPGRALSSKFVLTPRVEVELLEALDTVESEVFELDRRLVLQPRESVEVILRPDLGYTGWLLDLHCTDTVRLRWQGTLGFQRGQRALFEPGLAGASRTSVSVVRRPLQESRLTVEELEDEILTVPAALLRPLISAASGLLLADAAGMGELSPPDREDLVRAIFQRYPTGDAATRLLIAVSMPHGSQVEDALLLDRLIAEREPNPLVLVAGLLARGRSPENPGFERAIASDDEVISEMARLMRDRLASRDPQGFPFVGPDLARIGPPRPVLDEDVDEGESERAR
ncbi:MAG: hypothetical protein EA378_07655 [Phycisphaerales bacterium]|nr:MAG: hypothetical protein EA378_07655 [Phycisphaerales bacterium]